MLEKLKELLNTDWKDMLSTKAEFDLANREQQVPANYRDFEDDPRGIENEKIVCDHICSGNCRRFGCNCDCLTEFHNQDK